MDGQLVTTRRSLHGVGELVLAGPQYRAHGTIRLRVTPGGFGAVASAPRVEGTEPVWDLGRAPLGGTYRELAALAGLDVGGPEGLYGDTSGVDPDETITIDAADPALIADWFARGDAGLRAFVPDVEPVIWPEHFDLAITPDEVDNGISPGDAAHPLPYAHVGPWTPRAGAFWNVPFGALQPAGDLPDAGAVTSFFAEGRAAL